MLYMPKENKCGPLLDRIDIHIEVPAVPYRELKSETPGTSSADIREQVATARQVQASRFEGSRTRSNADMSHRQTRRNCRLDSECDELLQSSVSELGLSARAHDKVLRVARTIADLEDCAEIRLEHLNEAINYRLLDRNLWK